MESDLKQIIAERLTMYRNRSDISQEKLANIANLDRSYISRIERQIISPTVESLLKICRALDVSIEDFLSGIK